MDNTEKYKIINVWLSKTPALMQEVIDFWIREKALPSAEAARKRVDQVALIARDTSDNIIAISTIYEEFNKQLENFFYYYRTYIIKEARNTKLSIHMLRTIRDFLEQNFINRVKTRPIGMIVEVENKMLQTYKNEGIWPHTKFVYIGKNEKGAHMRVYYFQDARIS